MGSLVVEPCLGRLADDYIYIDGPCSVPVNRRASCWAASHACWFVLPWTENEWPGFRPETTQTFSPLWAMKTESCMFQPRK